MLIRQVYQKVYHLPLLLFLDKRLTLQPDIRKGCHDVVIVSLNFKEIAILNISVLIIIVLLMELAKMRM